MDAKTMKFGRIVQWVRNPSGEGKLATPVASLGDGEGNDAGDA